MIEIRGSADRGTSRTSWLESRHSFSFAHYYHPAYMGFRALRVLNEDRVAPASGFGPHQHRDMEILTWLLSGELEHRDSEGSYGVLQPGTVQLMTAGRGIVHSEMNPSREKETHLLQIWLVPDRVGLAPGYQEADFALQPGIPQPLATPDGRDGSLRIHQDAGVYAVKLTTGGELVHPLTRGRHAWLQVAFGSVRVGNVMLGAGDGAAITRERQLTLKADTSSEVLLFDLA